MRSCTLLYSDLGGERVSSQSAWFNGTEDTGTDSKAWERVQLASTMRVVNRGTVLLGRKLEFPDRASTRSFCTPYLGPRSPVDLSRVPTAGTGRGFHGEISEAHV